MTRPRYVRYRELSRLRRSTSFLAFLNFEALRLFSTQAAIFNRLLAGETFENIQSTIGGPSVSPSITTPASVSSVDGGATVTYTFTPPVVAGNPTPTVTRVLTLDSVDVTSAMSDNTYVATKTGVTQALVITYTAANSVSPNATSTASATVVVAPAPILFDFELLNEAGSASITAVPNLRVSVDAGATFFALDAVPGHPGLTIARHADGDKLVISGWAGGTVPAGLRVHYEQVAAEPNSASATTAANMPALFARRVGGPAPVNTNLPGMTVAATVHNAPAGVI